MFGIGFSPYQETPVMATKPKKQATTDSRSKKKETLKEKIHRHLNNKNDVITDDDIKNVEVGVTESEKSFRLENKIEEISSETENGSFPTKQKGTPWDVLEDDSK